MALVLHLQHFLYDNLSTHFLRSYTLCAVPRSRISRGAAPVNSRDHVVGDGVLAEVRGENGHCPPDQ